MSSNTKNTGAEQRLQGLSITLSGTLPVEEGVPKFRGRVGGDLTIDDGRNATRIATLNALAVVREITFEVDV